MHGILFLQDMAVVMIVAGLVTVIFHRLRQPVVLGYIMAGLIIGPHTPPLPLIKDKHTIDTLAELGVILLMFGLGLHFSLRDLARVGITAFVAASLEILSMIALGYGAGRLFGWSKLDSIFLGAILSISSTTIIIKALQDLGLVKEKFSSLIFGILIVEDILAIAMLALLSGIATTGSMGVVDILRTLGQLGVFLTTVLVLGLIVVPKLLRYVDQFKSSEMLLITALALCFGVSLTAAKLGYSVALGAFLIGAVVAEAREHAKIELLVQPVRDMFSAIFFVTIGMLIEPKLLLEYAVPIVIITLTVVVGKVVTCSIGTFVTGHSPRTSLKVGMGLAQIGEFSFIIAAMGLSLRVISDFLYPIAVMVSAITTLLTPYLIKNSDKVALWLERKAPRPLSNYLQSYGRWFVSSKPNEPMAAEIKRMLRRWAIMTTINLVLVTAIFIGAPFVVIWADNLLKPTMPEWTGGTKTIVWFIAAIAALPLLVVTIQKLRAASMLLAEMWTANSTGSATGQTVISHTIFCVGTAMIALLILLLSVAVLPPWPMTLATVVLLTLIVTTRWRAFTRLYGRAQSALHHTLADATDTAYELSDEQRPLPAALKDAEISSVKVSSSSSATGRLIREIELRSRTGASAVAIERDGLSIINPGPDEEIIAGDGILLLGSRSQIEAAGKLLQEGVV